ncbi:hypothetical protein [Ruminococcus flavefaciens]|uniref:hypothetical protein n=1 Tax=Ruminococcus flavefaciens TaxID=1265 RepID=UPI0026F16AA9|nr:hypothetical protein [Ruminococcus flavefaciens]
MDKAAIEKIVELSEPHVINEYGVDYTDKPLYPVTLPSVKTLHFHTLDGLVNSLKAEYSNFSAPLLINVFDQNTVKVYAAINADMDRQREYPYDVHIEPEPIPFERKLDYETMMILLRSKFVQTPELAELVKMLGSITEESSATASDDGFTQNVVVRKGIAMKENKMVKPIVKLKPYRTFNEVDQPESEFLLRLSEGGYVALYEADGGAWKLKARKNVAEYLKNALSDLITDGTVIVVE